MTKILVTILALFYMCLPTSEYLGNLPKRFDYCKHKAYSIVFQIHKEYFNDWEEIKK